MAVIAVVAARDMRWVLTGGGDAIVTGAATSDYLGVIDDHHGLPHVRSVAVFADIRRQRVCLIFSCRIRAVMAVDAAAGDRRMIESCRQPGDCRVTVVAGVAARDMCRMLADCGDAVMAAVATSDNLGVINGHSRRKDIGAVAIFTDICRLNVSTVLTGCVRAVMAADAVAGDIQVIEIRG